MATRLLIVGDDKLGRRLLARTADIDDLDVAVDGSTHWRRVWTLVRNGRLPLGWLTTMAWAEWRRPTESMTAPTVRSNADLRAHIDRGVREVFLFRAGLIVERRPFAAASARLV